MPCIVENIQNAEDQEAQKKTPTIFSNPLVPSNPKPQNSRPQSKRQNYRGCYQGNYWKATKEQAVLKPS
jgi:hypothetical protein